MRRSYNLFLVGHYVKMISQMSEMQKRICNVSSVMVLHFPFTEKRSVSAKR